MASKYAQLGKLVVARIYFDPGSTTTYGTGNYFWALPVTAFTQTINNPNQLGVARANDSGTTRFHGQTTYASTTQIAVETAAATFWGQLIPMTWVDADSMVAHVIYEAA